MGEALAGVKCRVIYGLRGEIERGRAAEAAAKGALARGCAGL